MTKKINSAVKAVIGALALFLMFTTAVVAQDKVNEGAKTVTTHLKNQLSLNDTQYAKVLEVNKDYLKKSLGNNGATTVEKAKKQKGYDEERDKKLKSVLSDSQYKIFIANRASNAKKYKQAISK